MRINHTSPFVARFADNSVASIMQIVAAEVVLDTTLDTLGRAFRDFRLAVVPVVDRSHCLIGLVTFGDLANAESQSDPSAESEPMPYGFHVERAPLLVRDIMKPISFIVNESTLIRRAARLMVTEKLLHLPVVDRSGRLVGIVSALDVLGQVVEPSLAGAAT